MPHRVAPPVWRRVAITGMMRASIALQGTQQKLCRAWSAAVKHQAVVSASPPARHGDDPLCTWDAACAEAAVPVARQAETTQVDAEASTELLWERAQQPCHGETAGGCTSSSGGSRCAFRVCTKTPQYVLVFASLRALYFVTS